MSEGKLVTLEKSPVLFNKSGYKTNATTGEPFENSWNYYNHASGNFRVGVWDCTAGSWYHEHPTTEFCFILEGSVTIIEKDGPTHVYHAGDAFIVPKGTPVTWIVEDYAKKVFVAAEKLSDTV